MEDIFKFQYGKIYSTIEMKTQSLFHLFFLTY